MVEDPWMESIPERHVMEVFQHVLLEFARLMHEKYPEIQDEVWAEAQFNVRSYVETDLRPRWKSES